MNRTSHLAIFFTIATAITTGLHYYFWVRLVRDTELAAPWRSVVTAIIALMAVLLPASIALVRIVPRSVGQPIAFALYGWMGFAFLLLIALVMGDVIHLSHWVLRAGDPLDMHKRITLARISAAASALFGLGASVAGTAVALGAIPIERIRIALRRLPSSLEGTTLVQISDVHIGPTLGRAFMDRVVTQVNALSPDIIAITGDLVDGTVEHLREHVAPLQNLQARYGVYFVTGNHEYYSGAQEWVEELSRIGIRVLRNERIQIGTSEGSFDLAGVDDWSAAGMAPGHGHDLERALAGRDPEREVVLLAHQPKSAIGAAEHQVGLVLSGHTHGGQIFPWSLLVPLQQPFVVGLHKLQETWVYVNRGTGYWGPPMRLGVPPEITHIELVRAPA